MDPVFPFRMQADAAPAQKTAWRAVWPDARLVEYTDLFDAARLALPDSTPRLAATQLLQPGLSFGRVEGNCGWHVLHDVDQNKGKLFKDSSRKENLARFKDDFDAYRKRSAYAAMAPVVFDSLLKKVKSVYKEHALYDWCARARARARAVISARAASPDAPSASMPSSFRSALRCQAEDQEGPAAHVLPDERRAHRRHAERQLALRGQEQGHQTRKPSLLARRSPLARAACHSVPHTRSPCCPHVLLHAVRSGAAHDLGRTRARRRWTGTKALPMPS